VVHVQQRQLLRTLGVAVHDVEIRDERRDRRVAVEHDVEARHAVADHALALRQIGRERGRLHVVVEAADRGLGPRREAAPVDAMRRFELSAILVDKRLKDALDVRANRRRVRGAVVRARRLGGRRCARGKHQAETDSGQRSYHVPHDHTLLLGRPRAQFRIRERRVG
jgi:hypothetical protein